MKRWLKAMPAVLLVLGAIGTESARASLTQYYTQSVNSGLAGYDITKLTGSAVFTADNSTHTLDIVISNTAGINADIAVIFFNYNGNVDPATLSTTASVVSTTQSGLTVSGQNGGGSADGFGKFDYNLSFNGGPSTYLKQGQSIEVKITYTGTITDLNLMATTVGGNPGGPFVGAIDWKPNGGDTGYGSASLRSVTANPEPSTIVSAFLGLAATGLTALRRRSRGDKTKV
ncbi:PEP-CTERM sorting domain-containing protein [Paludisphaera rhizosphaerae]|uniref:PEP-CTERM sorting domain-containing protein n=1 Tax=Paludisphaera rhizosphaerae TaxID=2711216 RepID=UPI0013EC837F|nr:PEP-CTERM sorting domain-containing protein [Paludisphaera rhizosphaerae]